MPIRPPIACNYPGCAGIALSGSSYCQGHQKPATEENSKRDLHRPEYRHLYNNKAWRQLRAFILMRDPVCCICGREGSYVADHIRDHKGNPQLFYDPKNLQGVCKPCHDRKTGETSHGTGADPNAPVQTGAPGKQWTSTNNAKALDAACAQDEDFDDLKIPGL